LEKSDYSENKPENPLYFRRFCSVDEIKAENPLYSQTRNKSDRSPAQLQN